MKPFFYILLFVAFLLSGVVAFFELDRRGFFDPVPYTSVELVSIENTDDGVRVVATFIKTQCTFDRLVIYGRALDGFTALEWIAERGANEVADRTIGDQLMDITVQTNGVQYDTLEFRTRHICDGEKVDREFGEFEVPE